MESFSSSFGHTYVLPRHRSTRLMSGKGFVFFPGSTGYVIAAAAVSSFFVGIVGIVVGRCNSGHGGSSVFFFWSWSSEEERKEKGEEEKERDLGVGGSHLGHRV